MSREREGTAGWTPPGGWLPAVLLLVALVVLAGGRLTDPDAPSAEPAPPAASVPAPTPPTPLVSPLPDVRGTASPGQIGGIRFRDVTAEAGLDVPHSDTDLTGPASTTSGAAVVDLEDDGDLDVLLTRVGRPNGLYLNDGRGRFTDITVAAGLDRPQRTGGATAAAFADIEGDGDQDLYLAGARGSRDVLLVNDGRNRFSDRTRQRGIVAPPRPLNGFGNEVHGVTFGDVNRDGHLDLLVVDWFLAGLWSAYSSASLDPDDLPLACELQRRVAEEPLAPDLRGANASRLYLNDGSGHFVDRTRALGLDLRRTLALTAQLADFDEDGWLDLAIAGDACTSRLYRNVEGSRFVDVTRSARVGTDENGMGSVVRDVDGDGRPDWLVTGTGYPTADGDCPPKSPVDGCSGNRLYLNRGGMRFEDATDRLGLRHGWWGWGAAIEDFGNDGRLQVVQTNGYLREVAALEPATSTDVYFRAMRQDPMRFWVRKGDEAYADAAPDVGLTDTGIGHALVPFDYDRDGRLDLLIARWGAPPVLYRNESPAARHSLTVRLVDAANPGNRSALGARVRVSRTEGPPVTGWIDTSGSYESQRPAELHVGLGSGRATRVEVWWPGATVPQVVEALPRRGVLTVQRGR